MIGHTAGGCVFDKEPIKREREREREKSAERQTEIRGRSSEKEGSGQSQRGDVSLKFGTLDFKKYPVYNNWKHPVLQFFILSRSPVTFK
jgi:hypothetical protein